MSEQTTVASIYLIDRHTRKRELCREQRGVSPARSDLSRYSSLSSAASRSASSHNEKLNVSDYPRPFTRRMNTSMRCPPLPQSTNPSSTNHSSTTFDQSYARRSGVSSRYDLSIVYALDEILTRGAYAVFAKWFFSYVNENDLPGCIVVIGLRNGCGIGGYAQSATTQRRVTTQKAFSTSSDRSNGDGDGHANATHRRRDGVHSTYGLTSDETFSFGGVSDHPVPYVPLDPNDEYPIFALKRQTGYPTIILLVTLRGSRLEYSLSCDGSIIVHSRETMRVWCSRVAEVLVHFTDTYFFDFYYDEVRDRQIRRLQRDTGNIGVETNEIANVGRRDGRRNDHEDTLVTADDDEDEMTLDGASNTSSLLARASTKRIPCNDLTNEEQKCRKVCEINNCDERNLLLLQKYLLDGKKDHVTQQQQQQDPRAAAAIETYADIEGLEQTANFVVRNEEINDKVARNWRVLQQLHLAQGSIVRDPSTIRIVDGNESSSTERN